MSLSVLIGINSLEEFSRINRISLEKFTKNDSKLHELIEKASLAYSNKIGFCGQRALNRIDEDNIVEVEDEDMLNEILLSSARNGNTKLAANISKYHIKDPKVRAEIAMILAKIPGSGVSEHIKNFEIDDHETLCKIAELLAGTPHSGLTLNFENWIGVLNHPSYPSSLVKTSSSAKTPKASHHHTGISF